MAYRAKIVACLFLFFLPFSFFLPPPAHLDELCCNTVSQSQVSPALYYLICLISIAQNKTLYKSKLLVDHKIFFIFFIFFFLFLSFFSTFFFFAWRISGRVSKIHFLFFFFFFSIVSLSFIFCFFLSFFLIMVRRIGDAEIAEQVLCVQRLGEYCL